MQVQHTQDMISLSGLMPKVSQSSLKETMLPEVDQSETQTGLMVADQTAVFEKKKIGRKWKNNFNQTGLTVAENLEGGGFSFDDVHGYSASDSHSLQMIIIQVTKTIIKMKIIFGFTITSGPLKMG